MSGRRIDDHKWWGGAAEKGEVFPKGAKNYMESSANGAGELNAYQDTTEAIKSAQMQGEAKVRSHMQKPGYRH